MSEKELVELLVKFVLAHSKNMPSSSEYERFILKLEEITEKVLRKLKEIE